MSNLPNWKAAHSVKDLLALSAALLARWRYPGGSGWHWSPIGGSSGSLAVSWRISLALVTYRRLSAALLARWRYPGGSRWHWSPIGGSRRLFWLAGGILADLAGTGGSRRLFWLAGGILADLAGIGHRIRSGPTAPNSDL